jgi:membrane protein DedA with SNARE-associated domain
VTMLARGRTSPTVARGPWRRGAVGLALLAAGCAAGTGAIVASTPDLQSTAGLFLALAASTLVSEDLACAGAGALAAHGQTSFWLAAAACTAGILAGDLALFFLGRWLGRAAVRRAPLRWLVTDEQIERCSRWLDRRGPAVIFASRLIPGTRLPTYVAAGLLDTSAWRFALWFLAATAIWSPVLVGASMLAASRLEGGLLGRWGGPAGAAAVLLAIAAALRLPRLVGALGRRRLRTRLARLARWEFWPPWLFYPPVVWYIALLAVRHRGLGVFTAANPGIAAGGFAGESKHAILSRFRDSSGRVARFALVRGGEPAAARAARVTVFRETLGLEYPVVLKPDVGQRGAGVRVIRSDAEVLAYVDAYAGDLVVQEYVPGLEFGVFYARAPGAPRGRIVSITEKRFPAVEGDGRRTLEELIVLDARASLLAATYRAANAHRLGWVPETGESVPLVEIGSHCRGALFLDGAWVWTPELERAIDTLSQSFEGFYFGRYDLRVPSAGDLRRGENFKVLELNGVTSEATHVYDPKTSLLEAYRVLFAQWRLAFEIGARNRDLGARPTPVADLVRLGLAAVRGG